MKKLLSILLSLSLLTLVSCGKNEILPSEGKISVSQSETEETSETNEETTEGTTASIEDEIKKLEETLFDVNITAQDIPADCLEIPSDWKEVSFNCGVKLKVPAEFVGGGEQSGLEMYGNTDESGMTESSVIYIYGNDWSETEENGPTANDQDHLNKMFETLGIPFDGTNASLYDDPLKAVGIDTNGTRYGRVKGLLSVSEKDLEGVDETTAKTIRWAKGLSFSAFKDAYICENKNTHVIVHQYGDDDNQFWLNVMPDDNYENCFIITAKDKETALRIAGSAVAGEK